MSTIVGLGIAFLAVFALVTASIGEPPAGTRTAGEYGVVLRGMRWWHPAYWVAVVTVAVPLVAAWYACRFAVYLLCFVLAGVAVWLATAAAMDGRRMRIYRIAAWREVSP